MKVTFTYDKARDAWCLLNKGKSSSNSKFPTGVYVRLVERFGNDPDIEKTEKFVGEFIDSLHIDTKERAIGFQREWDAVSAEFQRRAEKIFGVSLPSDVTAYLTVNNRCPYNIDENWFFVSMTYPPKDTAMHELWHFYTWYGLGPAEQKRLGKEKYNDLKEALTVLLNIECADLLDKPDKGYPQHAGLREKIAAFWEKNKDVRDLWDYLTDLAPIPLF
ncbi:MAG: hypothetical protein KGI79_02075 [Patescibacteria group bacterium]|nr:hypothetical protein [Patescibacteria group bacterium]MDE2116638.1 hypothetical protein [Patescibacteria group bacterium]